LKRPEICNVLKLLEKPLRRQVVFPLLTFFGIALLTPGKGLAAESQPAVEARHAVEHKNLRQRRGWKQAAPQRCLGLSDTYSWDPANF
jgi:hypothetical protein